MKATAKDMMTIDLMIWENKAVNMVLEGLKNIWWRNLAIYTLVRRNLYSYLETHRIPSPSQSSLLYFSWNLGCTALPPRTYQIRDLHVMIDATPKFWWERLYKDLELLGLNLLV